MNFAILKILNCLNKLFIFRKSIRQENLRDNNNNNQTKKQHLVKKAAEEVEKSLVASETSISHGQWKNNDD
jgi:hypothetical protein